MGAPVDGVRLGLPVQECAQELARCLADGGDKKGTEAYFRIHEIISARVRATYQK